MPLFHLSSNLIMEADQMVAAFFQPTAAAIEASDLPPLLLSQSQQEAYDLITQAMLLSDKQSDRAMKSGRWNATCKRMVTIRTNLGLLRDLIKSPGASTRSSLAMLKMPLISADLPSRQLWWHIAKSLERTRMLFQLSMLNSRT